MQNDGMAPINLYTTFSPWINADYATQIMGLKSVCTLNEPINLYYLLHI